jgi:hypothetical protein
MLTETLLKTNLNPPNAKQLAHLTSPLYALLPLSLLERGSVNLFSRQDTASSFFSSSAT